MAYRRSLVTRASLLSRQRFTASFQFQYTHGEDDRKHGQDPTTSTLLYERLFGRRFNPASGFGSPRLFSSPMSSGSIWSRNMSTTVGDGADEIEYMTDVTEVLADKTVEAVAASAPAVNEVAIAAADSAFPVAALQYLIDGVHNITGFNWWASIVVTTILIRGATIPLLINQLKSTTKLSLLRPHLDQIREEMQDKGMDPKSVAEGQQRMNALFKEYGVTPFTPLKGLLFQGPVFISFFLAISNMVEKVPSFKQGGAYWFTDLTTPDSLYIFPVLTALSFWITVEFNMQEGMEGNPAAKTMKNVSRVFALLSVPVTMNFPKALFCYWVTSNFFSLFYGLVLKAPGVKKFLNIPVIPVTPPPTTTSSGKPEFSFVDAMKKYVAAQKYAAAQHATSSPSPPGGTTKPQTEQKTPSSALLSQRIRSLEKQVKGKKKNKNKNRVK